MDYTWFYKGSNWQKRRRNAWRKIEKLGLPHRIKPEDLNKFPILSVLEMLRISSHPVEGMIRGIHRGDVLRFLSKNSDKVLEALNADENTEFRNRYTGGITTIEKERNGDFGFCFNDLSTFFQNYEPHIGFNRPLFECLKDALVYAEQTSEKTLNSTSSGCSSTVNNIFYNLSRKGKIKNDVYISALKAEIDTVIKDAPEELRKEYYKESQTEDLFRFFDVAM